MTVAEPWPADGPKFTEDELEAASDPAPLNQAWRAAVAGVEVVVVAVLALTAWWLWGIGHEPIHVPGADPTYRLVGSRLALSVAAVALAGLLAIDAIRQAVLAARTRR
ncbi:hypothetical protein [Saccharopolyspora taberi]|uniref:Uncharacterized protein n=1 Tax=Saccharopolyspora taberi TaxID=60895 RepID=A0ABN3VM46_9PSEU